MKFEKLTAYLDGLHNHGTPACEMLIYKNHELIYHHTAGFSDYEKTKPANENDIYNIFSNTKVITVVAGMQLIEKGLINLFDPLSKYIPEFSNMTYKKGDKLLPCKNTITVYNLFTMTAGFDYDAFPELIEFVKNNPNAGTLDIIKAYAKMPLCFEPGSRWKYSLGIDVLGGLIEVVSGMTLGEYFNKYIFEPLGMEDISFNLNNKDLSKRLSAFYEDKCGISVPNSESRNRMSILFDKFESGGGGIITTAKAYALFLDALANNGIGKTGKQILSPASIEQIKCPQLDSNMSAQFAYSHCKMGYNYGFGVRTLTDKSFGARSPIGEFGWDGYTGGYGLVDTDNNIAICYMENVGNHLYAWRSIFPDTRDIIYEELGIE